MRVMKVLATRLMHLHIRNLIPRFVSFGPDYPVADVYAGTYATEFVICVPDGDSERSAQTVN